MSFDLATLKTDKDSEQNGVWVDYLGGSRLKVARTNNSKYRNFLSMKYKQHRMVIDRGGRDGDALAEKISLEAFARHILLDWEDVVINKKSVAYTWEIGLKAMTEFGDFKADVETFGNDSELFSAAVHKEDCETVKKLSNGN